VKRGDRGIVVHGVSLLREVLAGLITRHDTPPSQAASPSFRHISLADQLRETQEKIDAVTERIEAAQRTDPLARRLATIPGVGAITASAIAATTPAVDTFRSARDYAAWLGLTPQPHSSGGKERLGRISKAGNRYLRRLLYLGASCRRHAFGVTAQISARRAGPPGDDWLWRMLEKKPVKAVAPPMLLEPCMDGSRGARARYGSGSWSVAAMYTASDLQHGGCAP